MSKSRTYVILEVKILRTTEDAVLVESNEVEEPVWIPKSQIEDSDDDLITGFEGEISIPLWIAEREGLA